MAKSTNNYSNHQLKYEIQRLRYAQKHDFCTPVESNILDSLESEWQRRYSTGRMNKL